MHHLEEELLKSIVLLFILTFLEFYVIIYMKVKKGDIFYEEIWLYGRWI